MAESRSVIKLCSVAGFALLALTSGALADGSLKDAAPADDRKFTYSFSITGTSDYIFRGVSQTDNDPTIQGSIGIGYGIFYAGAWSSGLDFGDDPTVSGSDAQIEIDYYAGIKPTWGKATFDFGVIYYTYPSANDFAADLDYVELKAGVSGEILPKLTAGYTAYYTWEGTAETGEIWTSEFALGYALPKVWIFDPTVSGLYGRVEGFDTQVDYSYWNAGLTLAVDKVALDFRYWDTDLSVAECGGSTTKCTDRFVFSVTVALP